MNLQRLLIGRSTTIKQLLDVNEEEVIPALVKLNNNFKRLRNPFLKKLFAKRVSIEDACKIAGCAIPDFLKAMQSIGFQLSYEAPDNFRENFDNVTIKTTDNVIELDVRPILDAGKDPLKQIMFKLNDLQEGQALKIINSFEPLPLIDLLSKKGFEAEVRKIRPDYVETFFFKSLPTDEHLAPEHPVTLPISTENRLTFREQLAHYEGKLKVIDVRAYEMPKPMVTILETLKELKKGEALFVHHKKVPVYLLPHLHDEGFHYLAEQIDENNVSLLIFKP